MAAREISQHTLFVRNPSYSHTNDTHSTKALPSAIFQCRFKEDLYRIWCSVNRLGDIDVNILGDTSDFVNPVGQLLLTRRGKTRMDSVGIVFEFYTAPL